MANVYDLPEVMSRLPVLQKAALEAINVSCDAVDYWPYQQEGFPYWWNRIDSMNFDEPLAQDVSLHVYNVSMALIIAHLTADGFKGENSHKAYSYIPAVLDYFRGDTARLLYDDKKFRLEPLGLWIPDGGARITGIPNGTRTLNNSGINVQQVAVVFSLEIPLIFEEF